jgi:hypothetical protein
MYSEEKSEHSVNMGQTPSKGSNPDKGHTPGTGGYRGNDYNKIHDATVSKDKGKLNSNKKTYGV